MSVTNYLEYFKVYTFLYFITLLLVISGYRTERGIHRLVGGLAAINLLTAVLHDAAQISGLLSARNVVC